jgi:lysyl-tRNA synthetase class 2
MENIAFLQIVDATGSIQVVLSKKDMAEADEHGFDFWTKHLDLGDIIGVTGVRFDTNTAERSVKAHTLTLLSKALLPLPDKFRGLQDEETRLRKRYLDILLNNDVREMLLKKSIFWNSIRTFLMKRGFVEVYTPVLEVTTGGGDARPFKTHHNALDLDVYLRISNGELWQKRLMVAGLEKTFEIGRQFRNEGMSPEHLQEYDQMEFYWAYANYELGMELVEELFKDMAQNTFGTLRFTMDRQGKSFDIDLGKAWERYDYTETIKRLTGVDITSASLSEIEGKLQELHVPYSPQGWNITRAIDSLWKWCRRQLAGPGFLVNEPVSVSPLAKRKSEASHLTERFHVIIAGSELGNGYSELNDPVDQAERFAEQQRLRDAGDEEAQMSDLDFVEALEHGMPPTCGFGLSERVFSFFLNKPIRECQTFPLMKPKL